MKAITSIYHFFFPTYPSEDVFIKAVAIGAKYLNESDYVSLSLNRNLHLTVNKKLFEIKILNHLEPCINFKINTLYQSLIFRTLIRTDIYGNNDPYFDLQKPFIKLLIEDGHDEEAFAFGRKYQGTIHEKAFVILILNELLTKGKIQKTLSFILENFNRLDYLLLIPKLLLKKDMVDSALSFAHLANSVLVCYNHCNINPNLSILKLIIDHYFNRNKIYSALGVIFLIEDLEWREKELICLLRRCLKENNLHVTRNITCHLEKMSNKILSDKIILSWAIDNFLLRNNIYQDLDLALSIQNSNDRFLILMNIIHQYILKNKFNIEECKKYMIDQESIKQISSFEIHKSIIDHYIHSNNIFSALQITFLIPSYHYDRIDQFCAIIKNLTSHNKTDIEKLTNLVFVKQIIDMIDTIEIREKFEKIFL